MDSDLIQYFIVNKNLDMSSGKIGAQISHAATWLAIRDRDCASYQHWLNNGFKKVIVLHADEKTMIKLSEKIENSIKVIDRGLTEIPENSFTVLGLPIMTREEGKPYVGRLRLLK